jgi:hypothetical protein
VEHSLYALIHRWCDSAKASPLLPTTILHRGAAAPALRATPTVRLTTVLPRAAAAEAAAPTALVAVARMAVADRMVIADRFPWSLNEPRITRLIFGFPQPLWSLQRRARAAFFDGLALMSSPICDTLRLK